MGYDGREASELALERSFAEAKRRGLRVVVLVVADLPVVPMAALDRTEAIGYEPMPDWSPEGPLTIRPILETARRRLEEAQVDGVVEWTYGDPATEILRVADEEEARAIVVGAHHHSALARLLGGDVAADVMRSAHSDVIVVRRP